MNGKEILVQEILMKIYESDNENEIITLLKDVFDLMDIEYVGGEEFLSKYVKDPASAKYHGSHPQGLIRHSINVAIVLQQYVERGLCIFDSWKSPFIIGLFHDLCKVGTYEIVEDSTYIKRDDHLGKEHSLKSLALLDLGLFKGLNLTEKERLCIEFHMGAYETDKWNLYSYAIQKHKEVLYTHTADMHATYVMES